MKASIRAPRLIREFKEGDDCYTLGQRYGLDMYEVEKRIRAWLKRKPRRKAQRKR